MQRLFIPRHGHQAYIRLVIYSNPARYAPSTLSRASGEHRQQSQATRYGEKIKEPGRQLGRGRLFQVAGVGALLLVLSGYYLNSRQNGTGDLFVSYELADKREESSTSAIFELRPEERRNMIKSKGGLFDGHIWSVNIAQPQLQIQRAYSPIPLAQSIEPAAAAAAEMANGTIRLLIRREPKGEVSSYLHNLGIGNDRSQILLSGPHLHYLVPKDVEEIVFIAGGTGIAPALQIAQDLGIIREDGRILKMHILWANRRREDCIGGLNDTPSNLERKSFFSRLVSSAAWTAVSTAPAEALSSPTYNKSSLVVQLLEKIKTRYPSHLAVDYFADDEHHFIDATSLTACLDSKSISQVAVEHRDLLAPTNMSSVIAAPGRRIILVAGPDAFVEYCAGRKAWKQGQEVQGKLGGLLKQLDPKGWEVWKL